MGRKARTLDKATRPPVKRRRDPDKPDVILFRRWLVDRLKASRWPRDDSATYEEMGRLIGVQPDVLEQAQQELIEEAKSKGRRAPLLGSPNRRVDRFHSVEVLLPKIVHEDWEAYCKRRNLTSADVLRSLVNELLTGPKQPSWINRRCWYRGSLHTLAGSVYGKKWPCFAKTYISGGASRALSQRAQATGTSAAALMRGMVVDLLEGRIKRLTIITEIGSMFDDESKYWTLKEEAQHG